LVLHQHRATFRKWIALAGRLHCAHGAHGIVVSPEDRGRRLGFVSLVVNTMVEIGISPVSRWIFNCYVIHAGEGGPVIVDAGLPCLADDLALVLPIWPSIRPRR
jgi:hypothetical protein